MSPATKKRLSLFLKVGVSVVALAFMVYKVDVAQLASAAAQAKPVWILASAFVVVLSVIVSGWKWQVTLAATGKHLSLKRAIEIYLIGFFFNNFLPSSAGGDVMRIYEAGREIDDMPAATASVVVERIVALTVPAGFLGIFALPFENSLAVNATLVTLVLPTILGIAILLLLSNDKMAKKLVASTAGERFASAAEWVDRAVTHSRAIVRNPKTMFYLTLQTVFFHVLVALVIYYIFLALSSPVSIAAAILYSSVAMKVTMIPISISGHGLREMGFSYFFALAGVLEANSVLCSLLFFVVVAAVTLPGGLLFVTSKKEREEGSLKQSEEGTLSQAAQSTLNQAAQSPAQPAQELKVE